MACLLSCLLIERNDIPKRVGGYTIMPDGLGHLLCRWIIYIAACSDTDKSRIDTLLN